MKALFFSAAILLVAAVSVNSAPTDAEVKEIQEKAGELRALITSALKEIEVDVKASSKEVAAKINEEGDKFVKRAKANLHRLETKVKVKKFINDLYVWMDEARDNLKADVERLEPEVKERVKKDFNAASEKAKAILKDINDRI